MSTENPFDPRKLHPYRPPAPGETEAGQSPTEGSSNTLRGVFKERSGSLDAAVVYGKPATREGDDDIAVTGTETIVGVLAVWAAMMLVNFLSQYFIPAAQRPTWLPHVLNLVEDGLLVGLLLYLFHVRHKEGLIDGLHLEFDSTWWAAAAAVGGIVCFGIAAVAMRALPGQGDYRTYSTVDLILTTVVLLVAALVEELFYRGLIYPVVRRGVGRSLGRVGGIVVAVAVSAGWFGVARYSQMQAPLVYTLLGLGLLLSLVRQFSRSLAPPVVMHLAFNVTMCVVLWLKP